VIRTDEARVKTILNISLEICANLAILSEPFLPFSAEKLRAMLKMDRLKWADAGNTELLTPGHTLGKAEYLFERINDKVIDQQIQKLLDTRKMNETEETGFDPQKENIVYEDFMKLDIRVATVLEAEKVPKTDKLLKLTIDTGIDKRTIVSGIAQYYKPEDLVGKQFCFVLNLEPRKLRGIESQGMILSSEDSEGKLILITPEQLAETGSYVR
jgi:methionyl-tRNA synthetase